MKTLAIVILLFSNVCLAGIDGQMTVEDGNNQATLVLSESEPGPLTNFYEQLLIQASTDGDGVKTKQFSMSNGRFIFLCEHKVETLCVFRIKNGPNTNELKTTIFDLVNEKLATLSLGPQYSDEFSGVFPSGEPSYIFKTDSNIAFQIEGATWGRLTIGFSQR